MYTILLAFLASRVGGRPVGKDPVLPRRVRVITIHSGPAEPVWLVWPWPDQYLKILVSPGDERKELPVNGIRD